MFNKVSFITLFTVVLAAPDVSELFDSFLKDTVDNQQLADGSFQTTYFNIPHRTAPGLIEPFIFGTRATADQISVSNIRRLSPVLKEVRRQQVFDGVDFDYNVIATTVSMDIKVTNLAGDLTSFVGDGNKGNYYLNGNLRDFVINVTMQTENGEFRIYPERKIVPTTLDMTVTGDDQERAIVASLAAQIVGDLVTTLFNMAFRAVENGYASKALENAVRASLA